MKNILSIAAIVAACLLIFDSLFKFLRRNLKKYVRDDSFKL